MPFCSQFIPMDVIDHPKHGSIVYHPSILPRHRGASAINWYEFIYSRLRVIWTCTYSNNLRSPWICLPKLGENSLVYSNSSYSWLFWTHFYSPWGQYSKLNHPKLFKFSLLGDRPVRTLIFCDKNTFFFKKSVFQYSCSLQALSAIYSKVQYSPSVQRIEANRGSSILNPLSSPKFFSLSLWLYWTTKPQLHQKNDPIKV